MVPFAVRYITTKPRINAAIIHVAGCIMNAFFDLNIDITSEFTKRYEKMLSHFLYPFRIQGIFNS